MALSNAYLMGVKNLPDIFSAIKSAQAPERFTIKFLQQLGFKSTSDRLVVGVLKSLGFIDESGIPKPRYHQFLDDEISRYELAEGIREAYGDLFALNVDAYNKDNGWVRGKLKTLTQGAKSDAVIGKMAMTFVALCKLADFSKPAKLESNLEKVAVKEMPAEIGAADAPHRQHRPIELIYRIHLELPAVRDQVVYDTIFKSLRENLL